MPPEYAIFGTFSTKTDVFSFGVILLETISGMKNQHCYQEGTSISLIERVRNRNTLTITSLRYVVHF